MPGGVRASGLSLLGKQTKDMRNWLFLFLAFFFLGQIALTTTSCKHDLLQDDDGGTPQDTIPNDTIPDDTTSQGIPCDPDSVYFTDQILPILESSCAFSGCHDAITAEDGVVLTTYANVVQTAEVDPFNPGESKIFKVITDDDLDDRMPPIPYAPLSQEQIDLIGLWISQGAQNLDCDPDAGGCNTDNVTYSGVVKPILQTSCTGCHNGGPSGAGIILTNHSGVALVANSGQLYGAIAHLPGFTVMPLSGSQLSACKIDQIKAWIDAGAPNN